MGHSLSRTILLVCLLLFLTVGAQAEDESVVSDGCELEGRDLSIAHARQLLFSAEDSCATAELEGYLANRRSSDKSRAEALRLLSAAYFYRGYLKDTSVVHQEVSVPAIRAFRLDPDWHGTLDSDEPQYLVWMEEARQVAAQMKDEPEQVAKLTVVTDPPGANVYLNGAYVGRSEIELAEIPYQSHNVTIKKDKYNDTTFAITLNANRDEYRLSVSLTIQPRFDEWQAAMDKYYRARRIDRWKKIITGLGIVGGMVGSYTLQQQSSDAHSEYAASFNPDWDGYNSKASTKSVVMGATLGLVLLETLWFITTPGAPDPEDDVFSQADNGPDPFVTVSDRSMIVGLRFSIGGKQ